MSNNEKRVERRIHKRFRAPHNTLVVFRPHGIRVGSIVDISMGGLTFRYTEMAVEEPLKESFELDIIWLDTDFHLEKVPFKGLTDLEIHKVPVGSRTLTMRQCAIQFGELTPNQMSQLEYFIQNHTLGEA